MIQRHVFYLGLLACLCAGGAIHLLKQISLVHEHQQKNSELHHDRQEHARRFAQHKVFLKTTYMDYQRLKKEGVFDEFIPPSVAAQIFLKRAQTLGFSHPFIKFFRAEKESVNWTKTPINIFLSPRNLNQLTLFFETLSSLFPGQLIIDFFKIQRRSWRHPFQLSLALKWKTFSGSLQNCAG